MLADLVQAGELPPIDERLPTEPMVVETLDQIGAYGGEWTVGLIGVNTPGQLYRHVGYDQLMSWNHEFTEPIPNLAESIESSDDGREYLIHLRAGVKWSDGEPFTASDIMFAYEDLLNNEQLYPTGPPMWLAAGDEPAQFEQLDDATIRVRFAASNGVFRHRLAMPDGELLTTVPRHYLEPLHIDYNGDAEQVAADEGFADWPEMFGTKVGRPERMTQDVDYPTLGPWRLTTPLGSTNRAVFERNPYYWKTDQEGSQLPYIDRVVFEISTDPETLVLEATNGEFGMQTRDINTPKNKPVLATGREDGDYRFLEMTESRSSAFHVSLNLTHKDPVKREIFNNLDFRIGLSYAVNRPEIIDAVFQRQGEPLQVTPNPGTELYDEELATQYTEFDPDLANQHLDQAGYVDRDGQGFRLGPDGQRISIDINTVVGQRGESDWVDGLELIRTYWRDVGVEMRAQVVDNTLLSERIAGNEHDANAQGGAGGVPSDAIFRPDWYFPAGPRPGFGVLWANWYNGVEPNEEPPEPTRRQMDRYRQLTETVDRDEQVELFREVLGIAREEFYTIGFVFPVGHYGLVKNNFHNVLEPMIEAWFYVNPGPTKPEQYYIE